jgi:competence protein ComEC
VSPAKRPFHIAAASAAAGLALSPAPPGIALATAAVAAAAILVAAHIPPRIAPGADRPAAAPDPSGGDPPDSAALAPRAAASGSLALAAIAAALVLAGAAAGDARLAAIDAPFARIRDGPVEGLRVHLATRSRPSAFGASVEVEVAAGPLRGVRLLMRVPRWASLPRGVEIGHELVVDGRLRVLRMQGDEPSTSAAHASRFDGGGDAGFDFSAHLRRRGIGAELLLDRARATGKRRGGVAGVLEGMRRRAERAVAAGLPEAEAALARGMVLGQDEEIDESSRQDWRDAGLAHLLAVSGQNVMLLVALALPVLALGGAGPRARGAALLVLVALYVPLAGAGPSLQRAGVMGMAGIAAMTLSRPASRWYALLLAAAATLALNPRVSADPGWQLSFVAVAGILTMGRPLARVLGDAGTELLPHPPKPLASALARGIADAVAITLAATIATAPIVAFHFGAVPVSGLVANLLALPAVAPAMWLGMVKAALGISGAALPPADALADLLGPLAQVPLGYLEGLAERCADLPGGRLTLPLHSPATVCAAYALIGLTALAARRLLRRRHARGGREDSPVAGGGRSRTGGEDSPVAGGRRSRPGFAERAAAWRRARRSFRVAVVVLVLLALGLATAAGLGSPSPPGDLTVRFLDIGQGDATLIQHPDGTAVLFDGGPPEGGVTRLLRRAGVRRLAVVVATHASRDHHGGLVDVLDRYPVGLLLDGGDGNPHPGLQAVRDEAAARGVKTVEAIAPMSLRAGGLAIRVLSPLPRPDGPAPEDPNPRAVVAIVSSGAFDLFLSADAESEALLPLGLPDVEAMKVPHHGSSDPGLPEVLDHLHPEIAGIEVGQNTYGHPAPSTLSALKHAGVTTYRTDRDGTVTLTVTHGQMNVTTEH